MFWTDRGTDSGVPPKVASADMDGGNLRNLYTVNQGIIGFITADIAMSKLYWGVAGTGVVGTELHRNKYIKSNFIGHIHVFADVITGVAKCLCS